MTNAARGKHVVGGTGGSAANRAVSVVVVVVENPGNAARGDVTRTLAQSIFFLHGHTTTLSVVVALAAWRVSFWRPVQSKLIYS